jgi:hypothetical protein
MTPITQEVPTISINGFGSMNKVLNLLHVTYSRRPVKLVWTSEETQYHYDALRWEHQIKGWSRAKKEALIRGDFDAIHEIVKIERKQREQNKRKSPRSRKNIGTM